MRNPSGEDDFSEKWLLRIPYHPLVCFDLFETRFFFNLNGIIRKLLRKKNTIFG